MSLFDDVIDSTKCDSEELTTQNEPLVDNMATSLPPTFHTDLVPQVGELIYHSSTTLNTVASSNHLTPANLQPHIAYDYDGVPTAIDTMILELGPNPDDICDLNSLLVYFKYWEQPTMHPSAVMSKDRLEIKCPIWSGALKYASSVTISLSFVDDNHGGGWVEPQESGVIHQMTPLACQAISFIAKAHIQDYGSDSLESRKLSSLNLDLELTLFRCLKVALYMSIISSSGVSTTPLRSVW